MRFRFRCSFPDAAIEIRTDQDTAKCSECGSSAKVERRLVPGVTEDRRALGDEADLETFAAIYLSPDYPRGIGQWEQEAQDKWSDELNDRIRTLLTATDPDRRYRAADSFQGWRQINPRRERTLVRLIDFCRDASPELQFCITSQIIDPLVLGNNTSPAIKHDLLPRGLADHAGAELHHQVQAGVRVPHRAQAQPDRHRARQVQSHRRNGRHGLGRSPCLLCSQHRLRYAYRD